MTIEIHQPELEALLLQRMSTGHFRNIEDFLLKSIEASQKDPAIEADAETLDQIFAPVRGMFLDAELDFSRTHSSGRSVDLA